MEIPNNSTPFAGEILGYSSRGGREKNEDAYLSRCTSRYVLLAVADGLGGCCQGELASQIAIHEIDAYYSNHPLLPDAQEAISLANNRILSEHHSSSLHNMKTTVALAYINPDYTILAHVGDTRIYAFFHGELVFQSVDHSAAQMAVLLGEICQEDIRQYPERNMLTRALGATENLSSDLVELENDSYDALLICSDGFWENISEREMVAALLQAKDAEQWLSSMRQHVENKAPPHHDNHTAIVMLKQRRMSHG